MRLSDRPAKPLAGKPFTPDETPTDEDEMYVAGAPRRPRRPRRAVDSPAPFLSASPGVGSTAQAVSLLQGMVPVSRTLTRMRALMRERRLPPDERRAAQEERRADEQMRRERDQDDQRARQLAAADAERRRHSDGGRFR